MLICISSEYFISSLNVDCVFVFTLSQSTFTFNIKNQEIKSLANDIQDYV